MKYEIVGGTGVSPGIAFLCPRIQTQEILKHYYKPYFSGLGRDVMVCDLYLNRTKKKTPVVEIKEYLEDLIPLLVADGIKLVVVTQPEYFKVLTRKAKTDATIGDIVDTIVPGLSATYCPNYARLFYDPDKIKNRIKQSLETVARWANGDGSVVGANIIYHATYLTEPDEIIQALDDLYDRQCDLTCDIETFTLKHYDAGIGTITFCWDEHAGVAFSVDYKSTFDENDPNIYGIEIKNHKVRKALKRFFERFQHKMVYHGICFDVYVLIYQLFMKHILDQEGLLTGLEVMLRNWDCTQLITYLATNSCAGNELGLKPQSQEFAGNYAQSDIKDIRLIPLAELLEYNLIDGLATWYVYGKNHPIMINDQQDGVYQDIFKPAVKDIIQMQLTGMPINMDRVKNLDKQLQGESDSLMVSMNGTDIVVAFMDQLADDMVIWKNKKLKTKQITKADLGSTKDTTLNFNPNSPNQLQRLLYSEDFLGLPIIDYTDTKLPATGAETLEKLQNHTKDPAIIILLDYLIEYKASAIILSTFLPAFLKAQKGEDGWHYLFGNFKLGGTKSGRLSSQNPNLTNIPSSGTTDIKRRLAKLIKECFEAPPGWLFVGLDFDSLEDKISAVTTKDPNKIKVYSDGYDGHCLRALAYFPELTPDIKLCPEDGVPYEAVINGTKTYFHSGEIIDYCGQILTGEELFNLTRKR